MVVLVLAPPLEAQIALVVVRVVMAAELAVAVLVPVAIVVVKDLMVEAETHRKLQCWPK